MQRFCGSLSAAATHFFLRPIPSTTSSVPPLISPENGLRAPRTSGQLFTLFPNFEGGGSALCVSSFGVDKKSPNVFLLILSLQV